MSDWKLQRGHTSNSGRRNTLRVDREIVGADIVYHEEPEYWAEAVCGSR
ncbi:hypothetical protein [Actinoplanes sp. NPDC049802]